MLALCGRCSQHLPQILSTHCHEPQFTSEEPKVHMIGTCPQPPKSVAEWSWAQAVSPEPVTRVLVLQ